jgi:GntR family transcriptional repressor for pyruvate dehydrogenase complex
MPALFRPIRLNRTFQEAVAQIADAIVSGRLLPGQALPGERALAGEMDVSRRTIREAIKVLAEAGVVGVVSGPGGGMFVQSAMVPADLTFRTDALLSEMSDVLEARRLIEPRIAQLAGVYAEREDFEELERLVILQREHTGNREYYLTLESRFHLTLARIARNNVLYETMKGLIGRFLILVDLANPLDPRGAEHPNVHLRTLEALRTRDPVAIDDIMDEHLRFLEDAWEAQGGRLRFRALPTLR